MGQPLYKVPALPEAGLPQELQPGPLPLAVASAPWPEYGGFPQTEVFLWSSATGLHVKFQVWESKPRTVWQHHNEPVYEDSCVEFFLQPCPASDNRYVNFEMNAAGTLLLQIGTDRSDRQFLDPSGYTRFAIEVSGAFPPVKHSPSADPCWEAAYTIPFDWLTSLFHDFRPTPGWEMRGNFYKCGDRTASPHYGCWSPVTSAQPDFHRSCDFGRIIL
ncbi:MAG: diguanylate cyclase [Paenibacillaceae bacterium]|jgi:hypothetical protein|nr:diguanylate cyclase [Paenibacillaceae bacterium]